VLGKLGWGHFSTVWLVRDHAEGTYRALKVQKSATHYKEAARDEIRLLTEIAEGGEGEPRAPTPKRTPPPRSRAAALARRPAPVATARRPPTRAPLRAPAAREAHCAVLCDSFEHAGPHGTHVCMVFEVLGDNLLGVIRRYQYRGAPLGVVRRLTGQMLRALDYMHRERRIIHTDFKPENVLLTRPLDPLRLAERVCASSRELALAEAAGRRAGAPDPAMAGLNRNQRKKLKKKLRRQGTAGGGDGAGDGPEGGGGLAGAGSMASLPDEPEDPEAAVPEWTRDPEALARALFGETRPNEEWAEDQWDCAVVDFGNACWTYRQFTQDIQTRQYRSPEVLLGCKYSTPCDMWSLACVVFELVTGDLLFDPRSGADYGRDEDHLALMIELVGRVPKHVRQGGKYAREFFTAQGELRHIKKLKPWPLDQVLHEKYDMPEHEARSLAGFLLEMLVFDPERRATAEQLLGHPWLDGTSAAGSARGRAEGAGAAGSPGGRGSGPGRGSPRGGREGVDGLQRDMETLGAGREKSQGRGLRSPRSSSPGEPRGAVGRRSLEQAASEGPGRSASPSPPMGRGVAPAAEIET